MKKKNRIIKPLETIEIVRAEKVTKKYGIGTLDAFAAVDNASLTVKRGEFLAVVGSSGSGKSTLMHMIGGVERPTQGKVYICGHDIYSMKDEQLSAYRCREIGMVYQFFNLIPVLNVEENIAFPLIAAGETVDFKKVREIMERLGIGNKGTYYPHQLSGGQQQRVAIARAVIASPSLILADEPTGNLDSGNSREVMDLLESLCKELGKALMVITHDEKIACRADRVIRIEDGRIVSETMKGETVMM